MDEFCYLDGMISAGGTVEASSVARIRKKFKSIDLPFNSERTCLCANGKLHTACVKNALSYGSEI